MSTQKPIISQLEYIENMKFLVHKLEQDFKKLQEAISKFKTNKEEEV